MLKSHLYCSSHLLQVNIHVVRNHPLNVSVAVVQYACQICMLRYFVCSRMQAQIIPALLYIKHDASETSSLGLLVSGGRDDCPVIIKGRKWEKDRFGSSVKNKVLRSGSFAG